MSKRTCKCGAAVTRHSKTGECVKCSRETQRATRKKSYVCPGCGGERNRQAEVCERCISDVRERGKAPKEPAERIVFMLRRGPMQESEIANVLGVGAREIAKTLKTMKAGGVNIHKIGDAWSLERAPQTGGVAVPPIVSDANGQYLIGCISDTHLCSVHERLDVLHRLYDIFEANGVKIVLHSGNYIDGEARFNRFELKAHGMDRQLAYLGEHYPQRKGVETWAVSGDDHEGWYCQREGVDIGQYAENVMRRGGRTDWRDLGYMEAFVPLVHKRTRAESKYLVMHPGGGTAYAMSYTVQKIVESFDGGEKPAVLQAGHYHKLEWIRIRNVWVLQPGCTQDQTVFMRKKKIQCHIGGSIMRLTQDPDSGAIVHAGLDMWPFYNAGYYENNRWSLSGPITQVPRAAA